MNPPSELATHSSNTRYRTSPKVVMLKTMSCEGQGRGIGRGVAGDEGASHFFLGLLPAVAHFPEAGDFFAGEDEIAGLK